MSTFSGGGLVSASAGGFISGAGGGFTAGIVSGVGNSLLSGDDLRSALGKGFKKGIIGGAIGGISSGLTSLGKNRNFFNGSQSNERPPLQKIQGPKTKLPEPEVKWKGNLTLPEDPIYDNHSYYTEGLNHIGIPYARGGQSVNSLDCTGFLCVSTHEFNNTSYFSGNLDLPGEFILVGQPGSRSEFINLAKEGDWLHWMDCHGAFYTGNRVNSIGKKVLGGLLHAHGEAGTALGFTNDLSYHFRTNGFPYIFRQVMD